MEPQLKSSTNLSHSFLVKPKVRFETQHKSEEVILVVRKHPLTQLSWILNSIFLIVISLFLTFFLFPLFFPEKYVFVFFLFAVFFTFSYIWINFLLWFFTVGIVTHQRIIDLDFYNVLYKEVSATIIDAPDADHESYNYDRIRGSVAGIIGSADNFCTDFDICFNCINLKKSLKYLL